MPTSDTRRAARAPAGAALIVLGLAALAGCAGTPGESGRDAEIARIHAAETRTAPVDFTRRASRRAAVDAQGRVLLLAALPGQCFVEDGFGSEGTAAIAIAAPCTGAAAGAHGTAPREEGGEGWPAPFPGLVTISVSGEPMFRDPGRRGTGLRTLGDFLATVPGRRMLARNGGDPAPEIRETRQVGDALYVRVHEPSAARRGILAPEFWRAFVELNRRMVLLTVSSLRDRPLPADELLRTLARQIAALRRENGARLHDEELRLAGGDSAPAPRATGDAASGVRALRERIAARAPAPRRAPAPPGPARTGDPEPGTAPGTSRPAPGRPVFGS
jgi:hypothetical protein